MTGIVPFNSDGKRLATASRDGTAKVWDAQSGKEVLALKGAVGSVIFSPDGERLATDSGNIANVWDARSGRELLTLRGHDDPILGVAFSPDAAIERRKSPS